jgi:hypothetical protein
MSLTILLALSILGCDFLLYFLFQWIYGEKRRLRHIRSLRQTDREGKSPQPRLVQTLSAPSPRRSSSPSSISPSPSRTREQLAYRRLAASLVPNRSRP